MSIKRKILGSRGDTIVEVLIAIAILSLVLAGAYQTATASYKNIVDSQQRIQALDVAQTQVEDLRTQAATNSFRPYINTNSCFQISANPINNNVPTAYSSNPSPSGTCVSQNIYLSEISFVAASPDAPGVNEYKITVTWPSVKQGNSQVVLYYRVGV
jgi:prepilin-type N-terminal cleavage/methylation domain-containing protein